MKQKIIFTITLYVSMSILFLMNAKNKLQYFSFETKQEISQKNVTKRDIYEIDKLAKNYYADKNNYLREVRPYEISKKYFNQYPGVIYLIIHAKSLEEKADKQNWFNLIPQMNDMQIFRLYEILLTEKKMIEKIGKYEKERQEIEKKYNNKYQ